MKKNLWPLFLAELHEKVKPATGCTEPISLAYACAKAASYLKSDLSRVEGKVSPNLMKNGTGVTVPGTGMVGLTIAASLGAIGGDSEAGLKVLANCSQGDIDAAKEFLQTGAVSVDIKESCNQVLYSEATVYGQNGEYATVAIARNHTNIVYIEYNGEVIFDKMSDLLNCTDTEYSDAFVDAIAKDIYDFALNVPLNDIEFIKDSAILNNALSQEGLKNEYGLQIARVMQENINKGILSKDLLNEIIIRTSAASDARMGGATLPAMSNSGSGNQGIAVTMPVVVTADFLNSSEEQLIRALALSHLMAIYIHSKFPPLSALCAATTASMGAAAGMSYLFGGDFQTISMAIKNMISDISGIICDGASNSCAMKVSSSAASTVKSVLLALNGICVNENDGIVANLLDDTITNLCSLASHSMKYTDEQIIETINSKNR